jgi:hypothetical protein
MRGICSHRSASSGVASRDLADAEGRSTLEWLGGERRSGASGAGCGRPGSRSLPLAWGRRPVARRRLRREHLAASEIGAPRAPLRRPCPLWGIRGKWPQISGRCMTRAAPATGRGAARTHPSMKRASR